MDNHTSPCGNFWNYACHNWLVSNPLPPWASKWSGREELAHRGMYDAKEDPKERDVSVVLDVAILADARP